MAVYAFGDEKCLCIRQSGDVASCPVHKPPKCGRDELPETLCPDGEVAVSRFKQVLVQGGNCDGMH